MCTCEQNINPCNCEQNCSPCEEPKVCPLNLDTSCVFYNLYDDTSSMNCLGISNGTSLTQILEDIDTKLCENLPTISAYDLPCLRNDYTVTNFQQFAEAVDEELCTIRLELQNDINVNTLNISSLSTLVSTIYTPTLSDCGSIGLSTGDTIFQVLQKYANAICNIQSTCCTDNSPSIQAISSQSISFATSGTKNHIITGNVKVSSVANNLLTTYPDGLYCTVTVPNYTQQLSFNSGTNTISLSNGGGSITLNSDLDNQILSLNCMTKVLSISNGNSVDLTCIGGGSFTETVLLATDSQTINFTTSGTNGHIITGDVIISPNANNTVTNPGNGLYVPASANDKVKLNSIDPTTGYLENKLAGKVNALITTLVTSNNGTSKAEFESVLDVAALLSTISTNPAFLTTFCNMVKGCLCFKFRITNSNTSSEIYEYVDCNGTSHTGLSLGAGSSVDVCGESANTASSFITINNLGYC
jgi:hypothetical protein